MATCKLGAKGCWQDGKCHYRSDCENKVLTNADRIRNMNDEELAMCLYEIGYDEGWDEPEYALMWLQQPAEKSDNER